MEKEEDDEDAISLHAKQEPAGKHPMASISIISKISQDLDFLQTEWDSLQPDMKGLKARAMSLDSYWQTSLEEVLAAISRDDQELAAESEQLAIQRYGAHAHLFCTLSPSISKLLLASARNIEENDLARDMQTLSTSLLDVREKLLAHIVDAKAHGDRATLRIVGSIHGQWTKQIKELGELDSKVCKRMKLASRRIHSYRSNQQVRDIDPSLLCAVEPSLRGYTKILDFYRHSDAQRYSFGRQFSGPQHFDDIRRNIAVLEVWDCRRGCVFYNGFAVSGIDSPGVRLNSSSDGLFVARAAEDGSGETYSREHDAEFKLCSTFCSSLLQDANAEVGTAMISTSQDLSSFTARPPSELRATLFSKKPLCSSCHSVVFHQLLARLPGLILQVIVDECEENGDPGYIQDS